MLRGALPPSDVPVDLTREQADRLAETELADPAYRAAEPSLLERAVAWVIEQVQRVVASAADAAPGGWLGIVGLVTLIVVVVLLVRWRVGPAARSAAVTFHVDPQVRAAQYVARAEALAAAGDWAGATSERMRALVRRSQERGLIDDRPGWTADEVAAALGARLAGASPVLARAARTFDDVRYGGRVATRDSYLAVAGADELVAQAHPVHR